MVASQAFPLLSSRRDLLLHQTQKSPAHSGAFLLLQSSKRQRSDPPTQTARSARDPETAPHRSLWRTAYHPCPGQRSDPASTASHAAGPRSIRLLRSRRQTASHPAAARLNRGRSSKIQALFYVPLSTSFALPEGVCVDSDRTQQTYACVCSSLKLLPFTRISLIFTSTKFCR